jgi:hypothetical protein
MKPPTKPPTRPTTTPSTKRSTKASAEGPTKPSIKSTRPSTLAPLKRATKASTEAPTKPSIKSTKPSIPAPLKPLKQSTRASTELSAKPVTLPAKSTPSSTRQAGAAGEVLSRRALNRATLARQMLLRREKVKPVVAIERLLGLQAQNPRPPFVALWSRLDGFRREDLIAPIAQRDLVRATMMRATIHLFSRHDFVAFRPALQPMLTAGMRAVLKDRIAGIDVDLDALLAAARACFAENPCTFAELREHLIGRFPKLDERAMGYAVRMQLPLVQVPHADAPWAWPALADFVVAESWLDEPIAMQDATAHALALRYFAAFGPASVQDFQSWSGLAAMRAVVEELRPKLRTFRDERGRELFDLPQAPRPDPDEEAPVRFLAEFDSVLLGYAERTRIVADEHRPALLTKNLLVPATFLIDGFIAGRWTVETKKGIARLIVTPFIPVNKPTSAALTDEGGRLLRFLEPDAKTHAVEIARQA